ncbi:MAG: PP2C family protein-serine/threonine phosphatase [Phycisphaerales bacterium]
MSDSARPDHGGPDALGWGEALLDAGTTIGVELGPEAATRFDAELLAFQKRRAFWYCVAMAALLLPFYLSDIWMVIRPDPAVPLRFNDYLDPVWDSALMLYYAAFAIAFLRMGGPRSRVMRAFRWLLVGAGCGAILFIAFLSQHGAFSMPGEEPGSTEAFVVGGTSIFVVFVLHFVASLFVALSPRDAVLPLIPISLVYVAVVMFMTDGSTTLRLSMITAWPLAGAPGVAWSTWRHRRFVDRFRWQTLGGRYRDIRADLRDARRVHESQFPAPIDEGPVRMQFAYEPMRDVGGDYLFAQRRSDGGVLVVVFDVSGHGVASALAASRLHSQLDRLASDHPDAGAQEATIVLNQFAHRALASQAIFASSIAIEIAPDGAMRYVNAGHPAGYVRREDGSLVELPATATLLGVLDPATFDCTAESFALGPRDIVVACTDGVHEAPDAQGEFFGEARLRRVVAAGGEASAIPDAVLRAVQSHRDDEPADDVLVVSIWRAG